MGHKICDWQIRVNVDRSIIPVDTSHLQYLEDLLVHASFPSNDQHLPSIVFSSLSCWLIHGDLCLLYCKLNLIFLEIFINNKDAYLFLLGPEGYTNVCNQIKRWWYGMGVSKVQTYKLTGWMVKGSKASTFSHQNYTKSYDQNSFNLID